MIKEKDQIQRFFRMRSFFSLNKVVVFPQSEDTLHFIDNILKEENWHFWTDSSGKSDPPPDFYSNHYKIMMDMMEVYDDEILLRCRSFLNGTWFPWYNFRMPIQ